MTEKVDFLIVGQGIAGTILAETIENNGYSYKIIDDGTLKNSSRVAGGLYNPITGRKMVKTWLCDILWDKLDDFYPNFDLKYSTNSFKPINIYFPFDSQEKQTDWISASADSKYESYISSFHPEGIYEQYIPNDFGGMEIQRSGYLDIPVFLDAFKEQIKLDNKLMIETFDFNQLQYEDELTYKNLKAKHIIFAEGNKVENNPYFPTLDFRPVKGELLLIKFKNARFNHIINKNGFILPIDDEGNCKLGATYERVEEMNSPTQKGKNQLLEKVEYIDDEFEILEHWSGIRPATFDRRPFIGTSKDYKNIHIFNGLGAKGVSLGPYFAELLIQNIINGKELPREVRLDRLSKQQRINLNTKG
ncbi:NAD(P)/FAD-dependent oxidoreductase [Flammeovirga pacifica]|uniref:FAD dependent oxidoreductase domain-containing protein n=1 Tax=Flammeovirga pacifica TaxID=915059 RepID=A0A1S1YWZ4_FLAPC|nr:FAD-dependent oxidoreductase [Flammeovirga pacifica]OHX65546.1 hypothetical protein NH26_03880 [Flammeovirga pacifica]